jgi:hypothetical protein
VGQITVTLDAVICFVRFEIKINVVKVAFQPDLFQDPVSEVMFDPFVTLENGFFKGDFLRFLFFLLIG